MYMHHILIRIIYRFIVKFVPHIGSSLYRLHSNGLGKVDVQWWPDGYSASDTSTNSYKLKVIKLVFVLRALYKPFSFAGAKMPMAAMWKSIRDTCVPENWTERAAPVWYVSFLFFFFFYHSQYRRVLHILKQHYGN